MQNIKWLLILLLCLVVSESYSIERINIWEGTGEKHKVWLSYYPAEEANAPAVIVCPGGSYFWLDKKTEGVGVAEWLQKNGIAAFVLEYRVAGVPAFITHNRCFRRGNRYPDPLLDLQRSIQLVRRNAAKYNLNPEAIGVMGFSAGGHLAGLSGILFDADLLPGKGEDDNLRPDFIVPVYPVVSFSDPSSHQRSCRGLLGEGKSRSQEMRDSLSLEKHVREDMPPVFLVNCRDDRIVNYHNSELLDSALTEKGIRHEYLQFAAGGHGFGAADSKTSPEAATWKDKFLIWLKGVIK